MGWRKRGRVHSGGIIFAKPLALPEGTQVEVQIEMALETEAEAVRLDSETFARLPFFGMWADRPETEDSAAWVRQQRDQWQQRAARQD